MKFIERVEQILTEYEKLHGIRIPDHLKCLSCSGYLIVFTDNYQICPDCGNEMQGLKK